MVTHAVQKTSLFCVPDFSVTVSEVSSNCIGKCSSDVYSLPFNPDSLIYNRKRIQDPGEVIVTTPDGRTPPP